MDPETRQIKLALMGVGRWGTHLLRNCLAHPQLQVRAVVDPSSERLTTIAQTFHLDASVALLRSWEAALNIDGLEAVAIATPATTHEAMVTAALKRQLHVLCEKPLTLTANTSKALCQLARQQNRQLFIDHTYLFHPAVMVAKANLNRLGTPRYGYAARTNLGPVRHDVDALWDLAIHDIAIFNHWLGDFPTHVQAQGLNWLKRSNQVQLADVVWCRLKYASGFEATVHLCWANPHKQRQLTMVCDRGSLIFDEMRPESPLTLQLGQLEADTFSPIGLSTESIDIPKQEPLATMCEHFVQSVLTNQSSSISSGIVGTDLVAILEALSKSLNQAGAWISTQ
ncbi:gfo/Idh/MocA family oxidoreductase [Leptolyngbyaceae cyanobacterium CCMR0082]|uniref:Gfo/Idh/MocA family oxidoreductase n=1 Tax=Adonisia turfae CCMR0082 TaxID=2304604 RepID=A0A6M0SEL5_9CYAN|nr:Gfo/Idh/MocA family oxidoreductase [Adonisia turfae]MDV3352458.1 Gfo/Idh/MocA family oxidoreductase [Leptothoe sp. LEGE 181152]NEZ66874.1 gfo/Idh/MocA family oxidoreductase [Adonisia turfae CCMR0082]